jgi:hypothetical protein
VLNEAPSFSDHASHGLMVAVSGLCDLVYLHGPLTDDERDDVSRTLDTELARLEKLRTFVDHYRDLLKERA